MRARAAATLAAACWFRRSVHAAKGLRPPRSRYSRTSTIRNGNTYGTMKFKEPRLGSERRKSIPPTRDENRCGRRDSKTPPFTRRRVGHPAERERRKSKHENRGNPPSTPRLRPA